MKLKKLCSLMLLAAIAAGTVAPTTGFAAGNSVDSNGSITYKQGDGGDPGDVTDPGEGGGIDEPDSPDVYSPLMIIGATSYVFGQDENETSEAGTTYSVQPFEVIKGTPTGKYTPHFVEFRDVRSDEASYTARKYQISAKITSPFTNGGRVLKGASITFNNLNLQAQKGTDYITGNSGTDYKLASTVQLEQGNTGESAGDSKAFLEMNTTESTGQGRFHLLFGDNTEGPGAGTTKNLDENVQLTVPGSQIIQDGEYEATITWTIADVYTPSIS